MGSLTIGLCYLPTSEKMYVTIDSLKDLKAMDKQKGTTGKEIWLGIVLFTHDYTVSDITLSTGRNALVVSLSKKRYLHCALLFDPSVTHKVLYV